MFRSGPLPQHGGKSLYVFQFRGIFDSGSSSTELLCAKTVPTASAGTVNSAGCIRYLFRTPLRYPPSRIVLWCSFFVARDIRGPTSSYLHVHSLSAVQNSSISIIQNASVRLPRGALAHFLNVSVSVSKAKD
jgi:hypothetical protein